MNEHLIWHNPRCGKSRQALALLQEGNAPIRVKEYLKEPPTATEIESVLRVLNLIHPLDLIRKDEAIFKELNAERKERTAHEWIALMVQHPILIQRPIVIANGKAVIGRPPELVKDIIHY